MAQGRDFVAAVAAAAVKPGQAAAEELELAVAVAVAVAEKLEPGVAEKREPGVAETLGLVAAVAAAGTNPFAAADIVMKASVADIVMNTSVADMATEVAPVDTATGVSPAGIETETDLFDTVTGTVAFATKVTQQKLFAAAIVPGLAVAPAHSRASKSANRALSWSYRYKPVSFKSKPLVSKV